MTPIIRNSLFAAVHFLLTLSIAFSQEKPETGGPVNIGPDGKLSYRPEANGDRIPDYSWCGYRNSEQAIPNIPVKVVVAAMKGDATARIQQAIDHVSSLPPDRRGLRGTILLEKGVFELSGSLFIRTSGVVLRGSGSGKDETVLLATGTDRETLISIKGQNNRKIEPQIKLAPKYFPVNSKELYFESAHSFKPGDEIIVKRPSNAKWLADLGTDKIGIYVDYQLTKWEPGDFDQNWDRKIVAVTPTSITLDVSLTNSLDPLYGGGTVSKYIWSGRISDSGVENLRCISSFDQTNPKDENHRWMAITIENASDCWVRRVTAEHFVSSTVAVWETARRITVEDCKSLTPVGEIGNYRRYAFHTLGQQVLFQRCYSELAYHPYSVGFTAPGPNAFVQCYAYLPYQFSGAIGGWASGILFDKTSIDGGNVSFAYRDVDGQGGGWSAANSLSWQSKAAQVHIDSPPTAKNWAYGSKAQGYGSGAHYLPGSFLSPESFFYAQLEARTGKRSPEVEKIRLYDNNRSNAPSPELAAKLSADAKEPEITMNEWIDMMILKYPIANDLSSAKNLNNIQIKKAAKAVSATPSIAIDKGVLTRNGAVLSGRKIRTSMWKGSTRRSELSRPSANLTRFVPGRTGRGLTDDIDTVIADLKRNNGIAVQHFPALWYERRRDDHSRSRRADADVWAPFYEQPFARSGQGEAFDRLSKYDLTKWNSWYWLRLAQFAKKAAQEGMLLIQEHYLQHNIIEEGAHWADYPWRSANNINNPGFAENTAYAGDKRVFMAAQFYDVSNPALRNLHRSYIRKSLDNFKDDANVIHQLGIEYTGPVEFVRFWLDVISEWEKEHQKNVLVMLPGTRDVQEAILSDPARAEAVDIIEILQWQYRKDGSIYSPEGGQNLAPRQHARLTDPGETSFDQINRAVREVRKLYPGKAVVYSRGGGRYSDWAAFLGGASLPGLPPVSDPRFFGDAAKMEVLQDQLPEGQYGLGKKQGGYILFSANGSFTPDLKDDKTRYRVRWVDPSSGMVSDSGKFITGGGKQTFSSGKDSGLVAWLEP